MHSENIDCFRHTPYSNQGHWWGHRPSTRSRHPHQAASGTSTFENTATRPLPPNTHPQRVARRPHNIQAQEHQWEWVLATMHCSPPPPPCSAIGTGDSHSRPRGERSRPRTNSFCTFRSRWLDSGSGNLSAAAIMEQKEWNRVPMGISSLSYRQRHVL